MSFGPKDELMFSLGKKMTQELAKYSIFITLNNAYKKTYSDLRDRKN